MATQDIRSDLDQFNAFNAVIASDATTAGAIIDTADYDLGLMYTVLAANYTDGTYDLLLEEDDDVGFGSATAVPSGSLIGALPSLSAISPLDSLGTVGVFGNKRFLRASIVSTATTTGAHVVVLMTRKAESAPVANP